MDCDDPFVIKVDIKHQQMAPQLFDTNLNPWDVSSLYDFQYFCCPQCVFQGWRIFYPRAFYIGELCNNTASSGTITKKKLVSSCPFETVGTKNIFLCSNFLLFVD